MTDERMFDQAEPVFPRELSGQVNSGFRAVGAFLWDRRAAVEVRVAAHSVYRLMVNGRFVSAGPARAAHGCARVDVVTVEPEVLRAGDNTVAIEVVAYHAPCYSHANEPGFVQAEVRVGGAVVLATGVDAAAPEVMRLTTWRQRESVTRRYSLQRGYSEVYTLTVQADRELVAVRRSGRRLLPRRVPLPGFEVTAVEGRYTRLRVARRDAGVEPSFWWESKPNDGLGHQFARATWAADPHRESWEHGFEAAGEGTTWPVRLGGVGDESQRAVRVGFPRELSGMIRLVVSSPSGGRLIVAFDEVPSEQQGRGGVDERRLECVNTVQWSFGPGEHELETLEPYSMKWIRVWAPEGEVDLREAGLRRVEHRSAGLASLNTDDAELKEIHAAASATFCQNASDLFMDCPSRERAGWLGDSFFTARAAFALTGSTAAEHAFLENYLLSPPSPHLPEGQLPMCYPADHPDGTFIPQWALWLVLQLEEFAVRRRGDRGLVAAFGPRVDRLMRWFERFELANGLLRGLPGWSFIEWSKANEFQRDLNYPTSMLYAGALDAAGRLYGRRAWQEKARRIRDVVRAEAFDGTWFVDNALLDGERYRRTSNRTEVCQYYAFYFGVATRQTHGPLWTRLVGEFGPGRTVYPEIYPANMIWGVMLRLELLRSAGLREQTLSELKGYLLPMARQTGTLWEHNDARASCNHGFASHAAYLLQEEVGGGGPAGKGSQGWANGPISG